MSKVEVVIPAYEAMVEFEIDCPINSASLKGVAIIRGPTGKDGVIGKQGPPGEAKAFIHEQMIPSNHWVINHGWLTQPIVTVTDGGSTEVIGDVAHPASGVTTITFAFSVIGRARLI